MELMWLIGKLQPDRIWDIDNGDSFGLANNDKYTFKTISYRNADLQNIQKGSGAVLSPVFNKDTFAYTAATVGLTEVDLTATLAFPDYSTLKINGKTQIRGTAVKIPWTTTDPVIPMR